ncbi:photosynthetic reaction center cytochrome c subunit [bacterium]|nr:photosynthetic reaction center cytochrome c subunit [bacterium]
MKKYLSAALGIATLVCFVLVVSGNAQLWSQEDASPGFGKNLKVLKFETKEECYAYMQGLQQALGVKCNFCHDVKNGFEADNPDLHKETARKFMQMVNGLNEGFFKDMHEKVTCFTCHQGRKEPVNSLAELKKLQEAEAGN